MVLAPVISNWDAPGTTWDSGLEWDEVTGPLDRWLSLVTSEHADKPKFMSTLAGVLQPFADIIATLNSIPAAFDLDTAVGSQLDTLGQWIGQSRFIPVPLENVYFSFDTPALGWDQGSWRGPFDPITGLTQLPDDAYRTLLRATVAANRWDGTIPGAYAVWNAIFAGTGTQILIQDLDDMHMIFAIYGTIPDAITLSLLLQGRLSLKPAGVQIDSYLTPGAPDAPYFGFDIENVAIGGWDVGAFGVTHPGS